MNKRILITGANGMLGSTLAYEFQKKYDVYCTSANKDGLDYFKKYLSYPLSSMDYNALINWSQPDVIVHCAAITNGNICDINPIEAFEINGMALKKLSLASNNKTPIIYISTDAVFSSSSHLAKETDCASPESVYGKSKELGEFFLINNSAFYTIIRTTIVGFNRNKKKQGFTEWIIDSAKIGAEINLFDDVLFTPISCTSLAENLELIINNFLQFNKKTLHIAGSEVISKYTFGIALLRALDLSINKVKKGSIMQFADRAKRSTDQSLDVSLFEKMTDQKLPNLQQTIEILRKKLL
jgi:dTDP-4-dehydrorhamnose reductase